MDFGQSIIEALDSLWSNKMRTSLTALGILIGVGAVIAMLGIGRGAQDTITGSISGIGTNLLFVLRGGDEEIRNPQRLTLSDAEAMMDPFAAPSVNLVAPIISGRLELNYLGESTSTSASGVTPEYQTVRNEELMEGEFINEEHILGLAAVAVLGPDTAIALFGHADGVVGETIRVEGQPFRVIGVKAPKGGSGFSNPDDEILIPLTTAQVRLMRRAQNAVDTILVQAVSAGSVSRANEEITAILRTRHRTPIGQDDFTIFTQQDFVETAQTITGVLTIFLGGVAAISLLVGGIGIMNIMLVSVTERTREIGLRKAVGARKRDIMLQFLTESALLSMIGGVAGIVLGWSLATIVGIIAAANNADINPAIGLDAILLATLFSTAVGLFFGIYPAKRAADLEPVEALRYE
ncbi:MAG: ABC transporter permease [Anaerolineales bacterium]|nr:ABC transporter permease [Anaerolineales bacterium]